jgi:hypothetical protein
MTRHSIKRRPSASSVAVAAASTEREKERGWLNPHCKQVERTDEGPTKRRCSSWVGGWEASGGSDSSS